MAERAPTSPAVPAIRVEGLSKTFQVAKREGGLGASLKALFWREYEQVRAVDGISFQVAAGERVGLLGPNGAGKTTTLKMLAGLLHPTAGRVEVAGFVPFERDHAYLRSISLVMGQKRQLSWDLPALDTYELNRVVFGIEQDAYRERLDEMVELLDLGEVVRRPVRQLSLGERMKCELVAALLHRPKVLFLDEPTLGMDVTMQLRIREFVRDYNERHGATVVLTSHYMGDVAALCPRVIVIDDGKVRFDGQIEDLVRRVRPTRRVSAVLEPGWVEAELVRLGTVKSAGDRVELDVEPERVADAVAWLMAQPGARDLSVTDAPLEEVMREVFGGAGEGEP